MKTGCSDLQIPFDLYSIEYSTKARYLMFKQINVIVFCKYTLIFNLMLSVCVYSSHSVITSFLFRIRVVKRLIGSPQFFSQGILFVAFFFF